MHYCSHFNFNSWGHQQLLIWESNYVSKYASDYCLFTCSYWHNNRNFNAQLNKHTNRLRDITPLWHQFLWQALCNKIIPHACKLINLSKPLKIYSQKSTLTNSKVVLWAFPSAVQFYFMIFLIFIIHVSNCHNRHRR